MTPNCNIPITYVNHSGMSAAYGKVSNLVQCILLLVIISLTITYIARIRFRLTRLMQENLNLLDKMHEGLIVVAEDDFCLEFAS